MLTSLLVLALGQAAAAQPPANAPAPPPPAAAKGEPTAPRQVAGSISNDDYPPSAIAAAEQGTTAFTVTVGPDGMPGECRVTQSSGSTALDTASCDLVKQRFRYEPARDESGKAVTAEVTRRVTWILPEDSQVRTAALELPPLTFAAGELRVTLGGEANERPRCATDAVGAAFQSRIALQCFGFQRAEVAELSSEPYRVVTVQRLQPEGAAPITGPAITGITLAGSMSATIEIDPQGG